jgi:hypothetical protein
MSLTQGKKSIDTMKEYGSGEKDGEAGQWHNKDLGGLVELLMDIVIDYTLLRCMQILWRNTHYQKLVNYL